MSEGVALFVDGDDMETGWQQVEVNQLSGSGGQDGVEESVRVLGLKACGTVVKDR